MDRFEKGARGLLWLALTCVCVLVPVGYLRQAAAEAAAPDPRIAELQAKLGAALDAAAAKEPMRFRGSSGISLSGIDHDKRTGEVWFTNVSARSGFSCLQGIATNQETAKTAVSMPACVAVAPYSSVQVSMQFAGRELADVCPQPAKCTFRFEQAQEVAEPPPEEPAKASK